MCSVLCGTVGEFSLHTNICFVQQSTIHNWKGRLADTNDALLVHRLNVTFEILIIFSFLILQVKCILDKDIVAATELAKKLKVPEAVIGKPNEWENICQDDK